MLKPNSISYTNFNLIILQLICLLITYLFTNGDTEKDYFIISLVSIAELVIFIECFKRRHKEVCDFAILYVLVLFLFTFGQVLLLGFFPSFLDNTRIVLRFFNTSESISSIRLINICFVSILIGISITSKIINTNNNIVVQYDNLIKKAKAIIYITFPIKIAIDIIFLLISFTQGFINARTWLSSLPNYIVTFGNFATLGIALLLMGLKSNAKKQKYLMIIICIYLAILIMGGRRSENVSYLFIYLFLFFKLSDFKFNFKRGICYFVLLYIIFTFLHSIVSVREEELSVYLILDSFFDNLINKNIMLETLREYGNTVYTAICVILLWLEFNPPSWGESYYLGLSAIFPNIGGIMGDLTTRSTFAITLQDHNALMDDYLNIGGSLIGEFFFNFGIVGGIFASLIFGSILGVMNNYIRYFISTKQYYSVLYFVPIMFNVTYWIRDCFGGIIRDVVWGVIFCYIMRKYKII